MNSSLRRFVSAVSCTNLSYRRPRVGGSDLCEGWPQSQPSASLRLFLVDGSGSAGLNECMRVNGVVLRKVEIIRETVGKLRTIRDMIKRVEDPTAGGMESVLVLDLEYVNIKPS